MAGESAELRQEISFVIFTTPNSKIYIKSFADLGILTARQSLMKPLEPPVNHPRAGIKYITMYEPIHTYIPA